MLFIALSNCGKFPKVSGLPRNFPQAGQEEPGAGLMFFVGRYKPLHIEKKGAYRSDPGHKEIVEKKHTPLDLPKIVET